MYKRQYYDRAVDEQKQCRVWPIQPGVGDCVRASDVDTVQIQR